eukprot:3123320-Pyramimonas_sp.AAC.1
MMGAGSRVARTVGGTGRVLSCGQIWPRPLALSGATPSSSAPSIRPLIGESGKPASPGIKSQLGRIKSGKHPHYRATTRVLKLSLPGPLIPEEREAMRHAILYEAAPGAGGNPLQLAHEAPRFASEEAVLQAFGLLVSDLPRVQALGESIRRGGSEEDSDPESDGGDLF